MNTPASSAMKDMEISGMMDSPVGDQNGAPGGAKNDNESVSHMGEECKRRKGKRALPCMVCVAMHGRAL